MPTAKATRRRIEPDRPATTRLDSIIGADVRADPAAKKAGKIVSSRRMAHQVFSLEESACESARTSNHIALRIAKLTARPRPSIQLKYHIVSIPQ